MTCTFFGNRFVSDSIKPLISTAAENLICNNAVDTFYVGNNGNFDRIVWECLCELKSKYEQINCTMILAYIPNGKNSRVPEYANTLYPDGLETVPQKYAIRKRNEWMIKKCDYVITYIRTVGNAYNMKLLAKRKGKAVIELYKPESD